MYVFAIISVLFHLVVLNEGRVLVQQRPITNFYESLVKSCSNLNLKIELFKKQEIFKTCQNWQEIGATKELTEATHKNVLCLLYYDSFNSFCKRLNPVQIFNLTENDLVPDLKEYRTENICKNLALFPTGTKFEHDINKIINEERFCYKLCDKDYKNVVPECGLAYYFNTFDVTQLTKRVTPDPKSLPGKGELQPQHAVGAPNSEQIAVLLKNGTQSGGQTVITAQQSVVKSTGTAQKSETDPKQGGVENESNGKAPIPASKVGASENKDNKNDLPVAQAEGNIPAAIDAPLPAAVDIIPPLNGQRKETEKKPNVSKNEKVPKQALKSQNAETNVVSNAEPIKNTENKQQPDNGVETQNVQIDKAKVQPDSKIVNTQVNAPIDNEQQSQQGEVPRDQQTNIDDEGDMDGHFPEVGFGEGEDNAENVIDGNDKKTDTKAELDDEPLVGKTDLKPVTLTEGGDVPIHFNNAEELDGESYFFSYFMVICILFILMYVAYHNRQKVMALMVEGKRGRRPIRGRRPNSANYHKLDSNLEEAISSSCTKNSSNVIY